ncbi:hypothetical protein C1E24_18450 [Pseudoalteromonas phenolica]|uniref:Lipoprotein n=1 Tax=Pseudoalteromonas phenolica TaxID=161398 RepID=A0A5R9PXK1_9GAMM|nr:hypothetical protein C1E24_18450 [Pseudoalteromonas phenolica]
MLRLTSIFLITFLSGCTATYQPLTATYGYIVIPKEDTYYVEYHGKDKAFVDASWLKAAEETCPDGYKVISKNDETIHGSFKSPVAGQMVNLGTQDFLLSGQIKCNSIIEPKTQLTNTYWLQSKIVQENPLSSAYVAKQINMTHGQVRFLATAPALKIVDYLDWKFGEAVGDIQQGDVKTKIWVNRKGAIPVGYVLTFKENCAQKIKVVPPMAMLLTGFSSSKDAEVIRTADKMVYTINKDCNEEQS